MKNHFLATSSSRVSRVSIQVCQPCDRVGGFLCADNLSNTCVIYMIGCGLNFYTQNMECAHLSRQMRIDVLIYI